MLRIGHRGAAGHAPENTLASVEQAISLGVDLVEVDLRSTRDGHLVIIHDERVDRTTNGRGVVAEMALAKLQQLDAGNGQHIPTLVELLDATRGRVGLLLEIKAAGVAENVQAMLHSAEFPGPVIIASFLAEELLSIRNSDPSVSTLVLFDKYARDPLSQAVMAKASHIGVPFTRVTQALVQASRRAGLRVFVYTVNDPRDIQKMRALDVDGIISDFPDRL